MLKECESHPDKWFRVEARRKYDINLARVARFLGSRPENVVFVENPTTGINAVMNCLTLSASDSIVMVTHTYNAVKNIVHSTANKWGAQVRVIDLPLPIESEDQIVKVLNTINRKSKSKE